MNRNQAMNRLGEILGALYWHERGTFPVDDPQALESELEEIKAGLNDEIYPPEYNERGNEVERAFIESGDRYRFDFGLKWPQFDTKQDAWYFGIWVNTKTHQVLSYTEGDVTLVSCGTREQFAAELEAMNQFYVPPPPAAWGVGEGGIIEFYDKRPTAEDAKIQPQPRKRYTLLQLLEIVEAEGLKNV